MTRRRWSPLLAARRYRLPEPGSRIAYRHAVYLVEAVKPVLTWTDQDRQTWLDVAEPDPATWADRPARVEVRHLGGFKPADLPGEHVTGALDVPAGWSSRRGWDVYSGERWPQCSCCGEPMPCRAEMEDREVASGLDRVAALEAKVPGACWACDEPVSRRQDTVIYPGENLLLPGREPPRFHTRRRCRWAAERYECDWLARDPGRERILTWPKCEGILVVHGDGSSECVAGRGPFGDDLTSQPDCRGHLTHDHGVQSACYVGEAWFGRSGEFPGCPRGCTPRDHPGTRARPPRPDRRDRQATELPAADR